jgi:hypothetical protein
MKISHCYHVLHKSLKNKKYKLIFYNKNTVLTGLEQENI